MYRTYQALPGPVHDLGEAVQRRRAEAAVRSLPGVEDSPVRLLVGPLNTAGQAHRWARAAAALPGVSAVSLAAARRSSTPSLGYAADVTLTLPMQLRGLAAHRARVLGTDGERGMTHVLAESARPVLGDFHTGPVTEDLAALADAGIRTAVVLHGSEIRDLHQHAEHDPHSPFAGEWDERFTTMQRIVERTRSVLAEAGLPVYVSTPDLLDVVPGAVLLPVVIDVGAMTTAAAAGAVTTLERRRPVVLHAPSNPRLKGTETIETVLQRLDDDGLLTYRRLAGVPHAHMPQAVAAADVVVDQIVLGNPGVLLAETLAAGRVAVAHLTPQVRARMATNDPDGAEPPVVEATPDTFEAVIRQVLSERTTYQALAMQGPGWARRHHDGGRAAAALAPFLDS